MLLLSPFLIMLSFWLLPVFALTSVYQVIACHQENKKRPPGQLVDVAGGRLHLLHLPSRNRVNARKPTVIIEHSLGGVEGYVLIKQIARLADVCLCDRAGYGWSDLSRYPATSEERVKALDDALTLAKIRPPYILVGNSLGSYHMRLYAHTHPDKVVGMVLTDGLHEKALLKMPLQLRLLQGLFFSGFVISILGSALGIVRTAAKVGIFEWLKPELRELPTSQLRPIARSFSRPKHWLTMAREIAALDKSGKQLEVASDLGALHVVNIRARCFFRQDWRTRWLPLKAVEGVRSQMHKDLMTLSTRCTQLPANNSSHFVWIDQPEVIVQAVELLLLRTTLPRIKPRKKRRR